MRFFRVLFSVITLVQHNMNALNAYNKLNANVAGLKKSSEKLSSGYRINRAGDDAAGLAISEKMRSQIRGLNQAVRNSQDGINMIQTYEGAAQESHSILQRMKELASESANGTYQNEVDRDAIQLEFNQLNDELNQIADTDFNGVAMLNGGQMADGTKAINGKFDYINGPTAPTSLSKSDINLLDSQAWNNGTVADTAWTALNSSWVRTDAKMDNNGPESVDVTFKYDATAGKWLVTDATNGADKSQITTDSKTNGGFGIKINNVEVGTLVVDSTKLGNGDTITLTFNNPALSKYAPTNAGISVVDTSRATEGTVSLRDVDMTVTETFGTDADMTEARKKLYDKLNGAQIDVTYGLAEDGTADGKVDSITFTFKDGTKLAMDATKASSTTFEFEGVKFSLGVAADTGAITIKDTGADGKGDTTLLTLTPSAEGANGHLSGTMSYQLGIEGYAYDSAKAPTIDVASTGSVSKSNSYKAATAPLTYTDHLVLQTGARTKDSVDFSFEYTTDGMGDLKSNLNISSREDGLNTANLSLATQEDANYAIDRIDNAINKVSMVRATFGASQNRLEHKITNLTTTSENLTEAESSIRDTDMASEMMNYTKFNILQQAAQSMLAQANQQPQSILQLLG